jgi:hypothetical protein
MKCAGASTWVPLCSMRCHFCMRSRSPCRPWENAGPRSPASAVPANAAEAATAAAPTIAARRDTLDPRASSKHFSVHIAHYLPAVRSARTSPTCGRERNYLRPEARSVRASPAARRARSSAGMGRAR